MNETTLASVRDVYTCCSEVRFTTNVVPFEGLRVFSALLSALGAMLNESAEDEFWVGLLKPFRYLWFDACLAPLTHDYLVERIASLRELLRSSRRQAATSYPRMMPYLDGLGTHLDNLKGEKLDHLLDTVVGNASQSRTDSIAILVKRAQLMGMVESAMQTRAELANCQVVGLESLRGSQCFDRLLVFGVPRWYPAFVFSAPRAQEICLVKYRWMQGVWKREAAFPAEARIPGRPATQREMPEAAGDGGMIDFESLVPTPRWGSISAMLQNEVESVSPHEIVTARAYMLEDDWIVFLEDDPGASVLIIDPGENSEERVQRVELSRVEPGMYVLLRTAGGGDYVLPVADRIMGSDAQASRQRQEHWKKLLRDEVQRRGIRRVTRELKALGSRVARPINVRNWMSYRNIGTHAEGDFVAIMHFVGLGSEAGEYWATMQGIHDAHRRAGHLIREMLLHQVDTSDLTGLRRTGIMEFQLPDKDAGSLTAFRVSGIADKTTQVVHYRVGEPISPEAD